MFDRYNVTSEEDLRQAVERLNEYIHAKRVTIPVTVEGLVADKTATQNAQPDENMAEGARFELADRLPHLRFSRPARSATPSPLRSAFLL